MHMPPSPGSPSVAPDATLLDKSAPSRPRRRLSLRFWVLVLGFGIAAYATALHLWRSRSPPPGAFRYRSYSQIVDALLELEAAYPQYVEVFSAQERYGLPLRDELLCTRHGRHEPCRHYVVKITDRASLPDPKRPEVFFSGALHGDERVGPQAAVALAELLAENAARANGSTWLKRLVATRTVVIMPTTNAFGYDKNTREELEVDPNRDFPYRVFATWCFRSMAARAVNEVWRAHLFQLAVTWHGGMRSVSYEWGSTNHVKKRFRMEAGSEVSPDDRGQFFVALGMSRFGGRFHDDGEYYPTGRQNDIVYAVEGGMEDWGYASSWEEGGPWTAVVKGCIPQTFGGYEKAKSLYNNATHRAFNVLVETSDDKEPYEIDLGDSEALSESALADYLPDNVRIGHVPRNVRLALFYIDIVQPYVVWKTAPVVAKTGDAITFEWEVAGAVTVDKAQLNVSRRSDLKDSNVSEPQSGVTRWYHPDMGPTTVSRSDNKGIFTESIIFTSPGLYYVRASATVDQKWAEQPETPSPNLQPQTHVVNARTNASWLYQANNKTVRGSLEWFSPVIQVTVV